MFASVILTRPTYHRPARGSDPIRDPGWRTHAFTYRIPDRLADGASVGQLALAPLQAGTALGVIESLASEPPEGLELGSIRELLEILDPLPVVTSLQLQLAHWVTETYLSPIGQALRLVLPPGIEERTYLVVHKRAGEAEPVSPEEEKALRLLERHGGRLRLGALLRRLDFDEAEAAVARLMDRGLVESRLALLPPKAAAPRVQFVGLLIDDQAIDEVLPRLGRASQQADVLLLLARRRDDPVAVGDLCTQARCTPAIVQSLERRGWVRVTGPRSLIVAVPAPGQVSAPELLRGPQQRAALAALRALPGPVDAAEFSAAHGVAPAVLRALERKELVRRVVEPALVLLAVPEAQVIDLVVTLRGAEKERAVLYALRGSTGRVWVGGLYAETGADLPVLQRLAERGLVSLHAEAIDRLRELKVEASPALSPSQEAVWHQVRAGLGAKIGPDSPYFALLEGAPGSGRTEIYMQAIEQTLRTGRRALVLVPEVGLAEVAFRRLEARFPRRVAALHGRMSLGQRYEVWNSLRTGQVDVLIGSRAALFAPISRLGLILVDEAHDRSYKQEEPVPLPAYRASDVALELGRLSGAAVLFGTATPDLEMAYHARNGRLGWLNLPAGEGPSRPAKGTAPVPRVRVVDLRQELRAGNRSIFGRVLQQALSRTLEAGEQAILFVNRRGSATFALCRDCGYVSRCPNCDIPMSLQGSQAPGAAGPAPVRNSGEDGLVCHRCNYRQPPPSKCPRCSGLRIRHFGLGTERVEAEVRKLFPAARVARWDSDAAAGPGLERDLQDFADGRADLLVGTQIIARGLDFPHVTLVGIISADTALNLPDLRAGERTLQLLVQVAGRAGGASEVILQTYAPEHHVIRAAAQSDYQAFYQQELSLRLRLGYPPFSRLLALRTYDEDPARCRDEAHRMARWLRREARRREAVVDVIGPAPCFYQYAGGRFRWQIVLRSSDPPALLRDLVLPAGWRIDVDPASLL